MRLIEKNSGVIQQPNKVKRDWKAYNDQLVKHNDAQKISI
jgi:hypothetical protein